MSSGSRHRLRFVGCITRTDDRIQAAGLGLGLNLNGGDLIIVVSLFQDPISYGHFTGTALHVPCLD